MTKVPYVGVSEKARKVRKMYIGVDGKARKVIRAYVGVNGIARLFYTSEFFLAKGLSMSNVIAAYQFKGAKNISDSARDLTGHGYNLTYSSVTWDAANGLTGGTSVIQSSLSSLSNIVTQVVYYKNFSPTSYGADDAYYFLTRMNWPCMVLRLNVSYKTHGSEDSWNGPYGNNRWGMVLSCSRGENSSGFYTTNTWSQPTSGNTYTEIGSGVLAASKNGTLYRNGSQVASQTVSHTGWSTNGWGEGGVTGESNQPIKLADSKHNIHILAAAFYNVELTAAQHSEISRAMTEIK